MAFKKDTKVKNNFTKITIGLASPEEILENSYGEVTKPETINYRTYKPERDGLFCERIFGPTRTMSAPAVSTSVSVIRVSSATVAVLRLLRRKYVVSVLVHIELVVPVAHIWYFRSLPNKIGYLARYAYQETWMLIIYYEKYVVIQPGALEGRPMKDEAQRFAQDGLPLGR